MMHRFLPPHIGEIATADSIDTRSGWMA